METDKITQRRDFVFLASKPGAKKRELIRRYGTRPPTAYKWLERYRKEGMPSLEDLSRRPVGQPNKVCPEVVRTVLDLRLKHDCWGARKLRRLLQNAGESELPSATTVHNIIRRSGLLGQGSRLCVEPKSFERSQPNELEAWLLRLALLRGHRADPQGEEQRRVDVQGAQLLHRKGLHRGKRGDKPVRRSSLVSFLLLENPEDDRPRPRDQA